VDEVMKLRYPLPLIVAPQNQPPQGQPPQGQQPPPPKS
jgi:hypothetical protein